MSNYKDDLPYLQQKARELTFSYAYNTSFVPCAAAPADTPAACQVHGVGFRPEFARVEVQATKNRPGVEEETVGRAAFRTGMYLPVDADTTLRFGQTVGLRDSKTASFIAEKPNSRLDADVLDDAVLVVEPASLTAVSARLGPPDVLGGSS